MSQAAALVQVVKLIADTIKETPGGVPSGTLYAGLMTAGCTLAQYESLVGILVNAGVVKNSNNLLTWVGA